MPLRRAARLLLAWTALALAAAGCGQTVHRFDRTNVLAGLETDTVGLILGEFPLTKVVDGDTIRVDGLDASLRLLGLDTEETFKYKKEYREFDKGWKVYLAEAQAKTKSPVKIATPMGDEAKAYAYEFFKGVRTVELERDHPKEIRDFYNRYLTYVFVVKNGKRLNYNVECVRAGMSPYFSKYGYSRRFHAEFVQAQNEARAARRGIWDPGKMHYPDYDRRLEWWDRRGDFIAAFEKDAEGKSNYVVLTHWDANARLEALLGREVVILGAVGEIRQGATGPTRVMLSRRRTGSFPLIFFDKQVLADSRVETAKGEFIRAHGVVAKYHNKYTGQDQLQIVVTLPGQVEIVVEPPTAPVEPEAPVDETAPPVVDPTTTPPAASPALEKDEPASAIPDPAEPREPVLQDMSDPPAPPPRPATQTSPPTAAPRPAPTTSPPTAAPRPAPTTSPPTAAPTARPPTSAPPTVPPPPTASPTPPATRAE